MSYCVKLGCWNSIFAVPTDIVDKHIKLVGSTQLKVLLWVLRNSGREFSEDDISSALSIHKEDAKDALRYWIETGVLKLNENDLIPGEVCEDKKGNTKLDNNVANEDSGNVEKNIKAKSKISRRVLIPDNTYIAKRIEESSEVAALMQEADVILGKITSPGIKATLLMLLDDDGLPIDVILMLIQYAVGVGKGNRSYIETVGHSWAAEGIDTIEKAEKKIKMIGELGKAWNNLEKIVGMERRQPTAREEEAVNRWYNQWNYSQEMVKEAYEICVNANGKYVLKYMDSIITRWHKEGIYKLEQVHLERKGSKLKRNIDKNKTSNDTVDYEKNYDIFDQINLLREDLSSEV